MEHSDNMTYASAPTSKSTCIVNSGHSVCLADSNATVEQTRFTQTNLYLLYKEYPHATTNTVNNEDGDMTGWGSLGRSVVGLGSSSM